MIEQDYAELLSRTPPSGDTLEWTFSTRLFAIAFPSFLVGTPALCLILFASGVSGEDHDPRHGGTNFRVPTLTRIGEDKTIGQIFTAGIHLAAFCALPLFWCVRLAHHQRLQARTGIARYDLEADGARRWVEGAWISGALGSVFLFFAFSVTGDEEESFSRQGIAHFVTVVAAELGMLGQAVCTVCAIRKARRVFIVSDADWASYRRKLWLSVAMILSCFAAVASVILLEFFVDGKRNGDETDPAAMGGVLAVETNQSAASAPEAAMLIGSDAKEGFRSSGLVGLFTENCDSEWCYSRSTLALWEWVFILLEAGFCLTLRNDLTLATGGVGVEGFVL